MLRLGLSDGGIGTFPIEMFTLALIEDQFDPALAEETRARANGANLDYCLPSRLEEMCVLKTTVAAHPQMGSAHYLLGNFLYDRRRHEEAIQEWELAASLDPTFPTVWRNLGIAMKRLK